ncbi:hypothetical protein EDC01DRAFT_682864 [Geopyxis carbonaria]|nr:hypothetical protein EDC01DRAFT_682864 [Geopyxis carbonaria]
MPEKPVENIVVVGIFMIQNEENVFVAVVRSMLHVGQDLYSSSISTIPQLHTGLNAHPAAPVHFFSASASSSSAIAKRSMVVLRASFTARRTNLRTHHGALTSSKLSVTTAPPLVSRSASTIHTLLVSTPIVACVKLTHTPFFWFDSVARWVVVVGTQPSSRTCSVTVNTASPAAVPAGSAARTTFVASGLSASRRAWLWRMLSTRAGGCGRRDVVLVRLPCVVLVMGAMVGGCAVRRSWGRATAARMVVMEMGFSPQGWGTLRTLAGGG